MLGSIERKEFESELYAWNWIHENFKGKQWYRDHEAGKKAGYDIYRDLEEYYNYICCLGDRLEVNLKEGNQTINLWIKPEEPVKAEDESGTWYKLYNSEVARICDRLYTVVAAASKDDNNRGTYDHMYEIMEDLKLIDRLRNPVVDDKEI